MPDIFDEISEDLRAERLQRLFRQYGWLLIFAAVLLVAGTSFWQYQRWHNARNVGAVADRFITAMRDAASPQTQGPDRAAAAQAFARIAAKGPDGYRLLARLQEAGLKAAAGDLPAALALWNQVSADESVAPQFRSLADLLWAQHQIETGDPAVVEGRLAPLLTQGNPWQALALECRALLKLRTGDRQEAVANLRQILTLPSAPNGVRSRANLLLGQLGEQPPSGPEAPGPERQG